MLLRLPCGEQDSQAAPRGGSEAPDTILEEAAPGSGGGPLRVTGDLNVSSAKEGHCGDFCWVPGHNKVPPAPHHCPCSWPLPGLGHLSLPWEKSLYHESLLGWGRLASHCHEDPCHCIPSTLIFLQRRQDLWDPTLQNKALFLRIRFDGVGSGKDTEQPGLGDSCQCVRREERRQRG